MSNPDAIRNVLISRQARKAGLRGKINAKCVECIYDPLEPGTWREQVTGCTGKACPLYEIRPTSNPRRSNH